MKIHYKRCKWDEREVGRVQSSVQFESKILFNQVMDGEIEGEREIDIHEKEDQEQSEWVRVYLFKSFVYYL